MLSVRTTMLLVAALLTTLCILPVAYESRAADWPGWLGPDRNGVSSETGLLAAWPKDGPKLLWQAKGLGGGYSTPSVARGRIYVLGTRSDKEQLIALDDGAQGKEVWSLEVGPIAREGPPSYPGPRSTPGVDGDRVYTLGSDGDLLCATTAGKEVWRKNIDKEFNGSRGRWTYAESPLIDGDVLVCTPGGPKATLVALNKKDGSLIWKASVPKGNQAAYSSTIIAEVGGVKQYVQFLGGCLVGVAAKDGTLLWTYEGIRGITNCTTPIFHDGYVFVTAISRGAAPTSGGAVLELKAGKDGVTTRQVFHTKDLANHHGGVVLVGDSLYGTNNTSLVCIDFKTGAKKWQNRSVGKGSIAAADGHLYVRSEDGPMALVEATPAAYKETGRFSPPERSKKKAWPHPVISGGHLYVRDQDVLLCFDLKKE